MNLESYRPEIDGIRALAVTAVIVNHFSRDLIPSGYLGVDIFFVISGFVITSSLARSSATSISEFLVSFYVRRIKRLVPALLVFVLITSTLISLVNPTPGVSLKTGFSALFGLSNLYLLRQSTDYFAAATELDVFIHTWSLGVEEQFYFVFPLLFWFAVFGVSASGARRRFFNLFWILTVLTLVSLAAFVQTYEHNQAAAYFLMPTRFWELAAGCLLFLGLNRSKRLVAIVTKVPSTIVLIFLIAALFLPMQYAVAATISVVMLTVLLIACLRSGTFVFALLTHPQIVYVGLISYSLYLWHYGVLSLSRWTIGVHWWSVPFQVALMLLIAIASYTYIEQPLRQATWSPKRWKSIAYGLAATGGAATFVLLLGVFSRGSAMYVGDSPRLVAEGVSSLTDSYSLHDGRYQWKGSDCVLSDDSQVGKVIQLEGCTLGEFLPAKKRVLVVGNSFSAAFTQGFDELILSDGFAVSITSSWGASPVREVPNVGPWRNANNYYWDVVVPSLVSQLKAGDWVFLASDLAPFSPKVWTPESDVRLHQLEQGLRSLSSTLAKNGIRLAVLSGIPFAREANCHPATAETQWFSPFGSPCKLPNREDSLRRRAKLSRVLDALTADQTIWTVDLFNLFCPNNQCTYQSDNGALLYRDVFSHPSVEAARLAAPTIREVLIESPRVLRRLLNLRNWSHDEHGKDNQDKISP